MALADYNKRKELEVTSQNDANTTQDKAQPIILRGNDFTGIDGFESGSSQLGWENATDFSIDTNGEVYLNNSLQISSSNQSVSEQKDLVSSFNSDGKRLTFSIKINNQTGNSNDRVEFFGLSDSTSIFSITFEGDGNVKFNGNSIGGWSANTILDVEIVFDFTNGEADVLINGTTEASNISLFNQPTADNVASFSLTNYTIDTGNTVNAFFDRLIYTAEAEDSVNSGGVIPLNWTNISSESDIALYDQNGNLLDYEIEAFDATAETATLWCYNSWTRDDSVQAQVVYGNGPTSSEENVTGTWGNTGQNNEVAIHDPNSGTDSTGNTSPTVTGTTSVSGQFGDAGSFDGTDDEVDLGTDVLGESNVSIIIWYKVANLSDNNDFNKIISESKNSASEDWWIQFNDSNNVEPGFQEKNNDTQASAAATTAGEWMHTVGTISSTQTATLFVDAVSEDTADFSSILGDDQANTVIGATSDSQKHFTGDIDEVRLYSEEKDSEWVQADYDASPKAGQVYFSQQAAEDTTQTISTPETTVATSTPNPQVQPGTATVNTPETTVASSTPNPQVNASNTVNTSTTTVTVSNPDPLVSGGVKTVATPTTNVSSSTPNPSVNPGTVTVNTVSTNVSSSTPNPQVQPGAATVNADTTDLAVTTDNPAISVDINVAHPTRNLILTPSKYISDMQHTFKEGDRGDQFTVQLRDENGPINLSNVNEVRLKVYNEEDGSLEMDEKMTITDASNGKMKYEWSKGDVIDEAGLYEFTTVINENAGDTTVPNEDRAVLRVDKD